MMFGLVAPILPADTARVLAHDLSDTAVADSAVEFSLSLASSREDRLRIAGAHVRYYAEIAPGANEYRVALKDRFASL